MPLRMRLCGGGPTIEEENLEPGTSTYIFSVKVNETRPGDTVRIVGASENLGNWKPERGLNLKTTRDDFPW